MIPPVFITAFTYRFLDVDLVLLVFIVESVVRLIRIETIEVEHSIIIII